MPNCFKQKSLFYGSKKKKLAQASVTFDSASLYWRVKRDIAVLCLQEGEDIVFFENNVLFEIFYDG